MLAAMRILLVDPDAASRAVIAQWLEEFFAHVEIASVSSGAAALLRMETRRPNLVLAAHPMPAPGGAELATLLKARPNPPLVVVVSDVSAAGFDLQCRIAGADLWLEKRHLQAQLLDFLQRRFPSAWSQGVAARNLHSTQHQ